jgi:hypothetical protein
MHRRAFVGVVTGAVLGIVTGAGAQGGPGKGPPWASEAEQDLRLGRGMAPRLMTEEEWKEHQQKMRTLTGEERERYRMETHDTMMERAKERGITMPPGPGPRR